MLTENRLKELLHYEPSTGIFTWMVHRGPNKVQGKQAGTVTRRGYRYIFIDGKNHQAHRLAWLYIKGVWPEYTIDHIDGGKDHNWLTNLRDVPLIKNIHSITNARADNITGIRGVSFNKKTGRYSARITRNRVPLFLGYYPSAEGASIAYQQAKQQLHSQDN